MALFFLAGGLYIALSSLIFLFGTGMQRVCGDFEPPRYVLFRELLDNREVWGGQTAVGFFTGSLLPPLLPSTNESALDLEVAEALK